MVTRQIINPFETRQYAYPLYSGQKLLLGCRLHNNSFQIKAGLIKILNSVGFIQVKTMTFITFFRYRQKSKMRQLVKGNFARTKARELPRMTKVHSSVNNMENLISFLGYVDEILLKRSYERIAHSISFQYKFLQSKPCYISRTQVTNASLSMIST